MILQDILAYLSRLHKTFLVKIGQYTHSFQQDQFCLCNNFVLVHEVCSKMTKVFCAECVHWAKLKLGGVFKVLLS